MPRRLEDVPFKHRVGITIIIVLAVLLALALFGYLTGGWDTPAQAETPSSKWEASIIGLDKQALDQAYVGQMAHVFGIWIKDGVADPSRARVGFANARKGYDAARSEIEKREERR
jgi:hypothetical protein